MKLVEWDGRHREIRSRFEAIGSAHRAEIVAARRLRRLPTDAWRALASAGLFGLTTRGEVGPRAGLSELGAAVEGLVCGAADAGLAIAVISQAALSIPIVDEFCAAGRRDSILAELTRGALAAFAITEPHGGSNARDLRTSLTSDGRGAWRLNGEKWHVTNAPDASVIVTFARTVPDGDYTAVCVDGQAGGVHIGPVIETAGVPNAPAAAITFREVRIGPEQILGAPGEAPTILKAAFLRERLLSPFPVLGFADHAIGAVMDFIAQRHSGGRPLGEFQYVQGRLTDAAVGVETLRATAHAAMARYVRGANASAEASLAKLYAGRVAVALATDAIKVCGSYGLLEATGFPAALADALAATIAGGTEEAQRDVVYRRLKRKKGSWHLL
ncbi:MAG TPA: acyl-CoA dehydrogenase family protein [Tepidisphaeraceae bacterium]|jgi:isovaleryl-CoA dehydrogenase